MKLSQVKNMPISTTNKWPMETNLPFSFFLVFIDADHPTLNFGAEIGLVG